MSTRKNRGLTQKLFIIESKSDYDYVIMGSTGNVYDVTISNIPTCTCPDFTTRGNRCKHIYFIMMKIMKVINDDREEYSDDDIAQMVLNKNLNPLFYINDKIKEKYTKIISNMGSSLAKGVDDLCPFCLDDIDNGEEYEFCKQECNKCVHIECFNMWCKKNEAICVFCKKPWTNESSLYINLTI